MQGNKDLGKVWLEYYTTRDKDSLYMKQSLFANCYSKINELNLLKHIHTHTHSSGVIRSKESLALFWYFRKYNLGKSQAENLIIITFKD